MANRVIKDSIWHSNRLSECSVLAQLHYPRLYLLVDDWGCFEVDLDVIRGKVYPKIKISCDKIGGFFKEYIDNGLLFTWKINSKNCGYFTGDEEGRLPSPSRRHKRHTSVPPKKALADYLSKFSNLHGLPTKGYKVGSRCLQNGFPNPNPNPNPNLNLNLDKKVISQIIKYLNEKTGKEFSSKSQASIDFINGRLADGRTFGDFKRVIDIKVDQWKDDPKMSGFLRPSTLFRPTNFENYLNETLIIPTGKSTYTPSKEDKQRQITIESFRKTLMAKYKPEIDKAKKAKDFDTLQGIEETIRAEVAQKSQEI